MGGVLQSCWSALLRGALPVTALHPALSAGVVYLGRWQDVPVAIKALEAPDGRVEAHAAAWLAGGLAREAGIMARLRHPHLVLYLGESSFGRRPAALSRVNNVAGFSFFSG